MKVLRKEEKRAFVYSAGIFPLFVEFQDIAQRALLSLERNLSFKSFD